MLKPNLYETGSQKAISSPPAGLYLGVLRRAVKDYYCFKFNEGPKEDVKEGVYVRGWVKHNQFMMSLISTAAGTDVENFRVYLTRLLDRIDKGFRPLIIDERVHRRRAKR